MKARSTSGPIAVSPADTAASRRGHAPDQQLRLLASSYQEWKIPLLGSPDVAALVAGICAAMLAGFAVRMFALPAGGFPLGDGGMFYVMVNEILHHHYALPATTSYNGEHIPFTYPPLGFYVLAGLHSLTGASVLVLFRVVPLAISVLTIGVFALLANGLLGSRVAVLGATFAFATLPQTYEWQIQGGGITRSFGMLFALATVWRGVVALDGNRRDICLSVLFLALAVLSHVEWTWFAGYSLVLLAASKGPRRARLLRLATIFVGAGTLVLPWILVELSMHGLSPFAALLTGQGGAIPWYVGLVNLAGFTLTPSIWFPLAAALAGLGIVVSLSRGQWLLPTWLLVVLLIDGRAPLERVAVVVPLLAGVAIAALVDARFLYDYQSRWTNSTVVMVFGGSLLWTMCSALVWDAQGTAAVSPPARDAMAWVRTHTPQTSTFAVVTSAYWGLDFDAEWFPALSGRTSLATVQGSEWLRGRFSRLYNEDLSLQRCSPRGSACLRAWTHRYRMRPDYVYVAKAAALPLAGGSVLPDTDCCWSLRSALSHDAAFVRVYDGPGASIFQWRSRTAGAAGS